MAIHKLAKRYSLLLTRIMRPIFSATGLLNAPGAVQSNWIMVALTRQSVPIIKQDCSGIKNNYLVEGSEAMK